MAEAPEDIIELTDIIEHGPGVGKKDGADGGVDLSFEKELEDLFAESPEPTPAKPGQGADLDLPGLDSLNLPEEHAAGSADADIDLDGLDALLAEADKGDLGGADLPELTDDFLNDPLAGLDLPKDEQNAQDLSGPDSPPAAAPDKTVREAPAEAPQVPDAALLAAAGVAAGAVAGAAVMAASSPKDQAALPALEAMGQRLDALEDKISGLSEAIAQLKAELSVHSSTPLEDKPDPTALLEELKTGLEAQLAAIRADIPAPAPALDQAALAEEVKAKVLAELPSGDDSSGQVMEQVEARLAAFKEELPEPQALDGEELANRLKEEVLAGLPQPAALDEEALAETLTAKVLASLPAPVDQEALGEAVTAKVLASLPESAQPDQEALAQAAMDKVLASLPAPADQEVLAETVTAKVLASLPAPPDPADAAGLAEQRLRPELDQLKASLDAAGPQALAALEARLAALEAAPTPAPAPAATPAPDLSGLVTTEALEAMRWNLMAEIRRAVPAAAAQIIREEIQALVRDME